MIPYISSHLIVNLLYVGARVEQAGDERAVPALRRVDQRALGW